MVALLREFPAVRVTFNLVPSLLVQLEAFAANRARDRVSRPRPEAGRRPHRAGHRLHPPELLSRAAAANDRDLPAVRGAAGAARPHGHAGRGSRGRAALQRRRPARPAGLAEARVARSRSISTATPGSGRWSPRGGVQRRGQVAAAGHRARAAERRDSRVPRRGGAGAGRAVDVAVLPSDPAAAVRHRHLQADPPGFADAAAAVPSPRGRARAVDPRGRVPRAAVRAPAGRAVAVRRLGVGRDGAARREGGLRVDGDRRTDSRADAGLHVFARRDGTGGSARPPVHPVSRSRPGPRRCSACSAITPCRT